MSGPPRPQWRLLDTGAADGFTNMATDEAILDVFGAAGGLPTLRFYAWFPPALSLGYGQPIASNIDLTQCRALGIDVVRRPTGGRAVLHDHEVTYSVVLSADDRRAASGVLACYLTISQALIRGLFYLGIVAEVLPLRRAALLPSDDASAVCFATPSSYEVAVAGRKVIGSAQRRAHGVIMQHGSVPLSWDLDKMRAVFGPSSLASRSDPEAQEYHPRMTSLREAGGRVYDYAEVVAALTRGIAETWEVELTQGELTSEERRLSDHLRATKYRSETWTWHR
ncbi:MAG TPA: lipoate--protein ligase family protein [Candidatus Tectomicrobia bacterium]|nr:lipoate--protein ligase family protein [Candidatus Tectomicrobia bacterium]